MKFQFLNSKFQTSNFKYSLWFQPRETGEYIVVIFVKVSNFDKEKKKLKTDKNKNSKSQVIKLEFGI